ncbi:Crp/Fnr family transcriptional regulator [Paenibacillus swuensis]|uniref:Crp/Fnr family transcriptional regulator n=1 Tax=Paenibacillus swuensis TaxID=1178515 RepID=A0A172TEJ7_9BACL|nr:cyclic nucleotide-binding domain-containing protein [Paenibacillus swuensis]ANE45324.1 Crp/Fnr family transcriptional regulator [Paenibacillus swuensis]
MKALNDPVQLQHYLQLHRIESIFNEGIQPYLSLYSYDRGETICAQSEPSHRLYVLVKGKLKIYTTSAEGKTLILSFKTPLEVIGDIEYVQNINTINTVEAVSPVHMIGVPYSILRQYAGDYAPFLQFLLDIITRKFHKKSNSSNFNLMYPVEVRLASYLLSVIYDEQDGAQNGRLSTSNLTDVANLIGTSYRHLNRVIHQFRIDGLINRSKGFIVITHKEALEALANRNIYE